MVTTVRRLADVVLFSMGLQAMAARTARIPIAALKTVADLGFFMAVPPSG